ncbi:hypothetical protein PSYAE_24927, partial [Pseudomonas amygdali pv. aesculi str. 0893_23]
EGTFFGGLPCIGIIEIPIHELGDGLTRLVTETRVQCLDAVALRQFRPYWYLIRPFSGLIRRRVLKAIQRKVLPRITI